MRPIERGAEDGTQRPGSSLASPSRSTRLGSRKRSFNRADAGERHRHMKTHRAVASIMKALDSIARGKSLRSRRGLRSNTSRPSREAGGENRRPRSGAISIGDGTDASGALSCVCLTLEQAAHTLEVQLPIESSSSCDVGDGSERRRKVRAESRVRSGAFARRPRTRDLLSRPQGSWRLACMSAS